jgi:FAD dependent oxidoreductase TIGR03364
MHLAYHDDEAQVLTEFARKAGGELVCELLDPAGVRARSPAVKPDGLIGGMWSPTEICVDPREVIARLPGWLEERYGVRFRFGCSVTGYDQPNVRAGGEEWQAERLFVCSGDDLQSLYPQALAGAGLVRCKLQMMRTPPVAGWRLGPMLAAGLTLRHYGAFRDCPFLPTLRRRITTELPEYDQYGIHVMAAQNGRGELIIGDSHEYGEAVEPFDKPEIDALILRYLDQFLVVADLRIAARWNGVYVKHPTEPCVLARPAPGVTVVAGAGGAGMTLSFGLAEQVVCGAIGEE